eukprot:TRINITY_DN21253_c0_g1_i1.p1 TRINITY_DN21253_c0_g1~~TRINITY_DN21253_c0_g1_i1.p1  ORF type:complete len:818 (+),score=102.88 TRINITY_DN21253_c0_g1_i1:76-2529(+)
MTDGSRAKWADDSSAKKCGGCGAAFSLMKRRHHCRACGGLYCASCSAYRGMVDRYKSPQRVCTTCYSALSAASYDDSPPNSPRSPRSPTSSPYNISESQQQLVIKLHNISHSIATNFPSYDFCHWLSIETQKRRIIVQLPTEQQWDMTIGIISELTKLVGSTPSHLNQIRKPMAEAVLTSQALNKYWINRPAASELNHTTEAATESAGSEWHPDIVSSSVNNVYQETNALYLARKDQNSIQYGRFVGTFCLNTNGNADLKASLLTTCLTQLYSASDRQNPIYVIGRCGRIDTSVKCRELLLLVTEAIKKTRSEQQPLLDYKPTRIRICSLLNAISIDKKESQFFRAQCSTLTGSDAIRDPMPVHRTKSLKIRSTQRPSPPPSPSDQLTEDLIAQHKDHLNVHGCGSSMSSYQSEDLSLSSANNTERDDAATLDFEACLNSLNVEYSYINLVANWPLSLRLGSSQSPAHNICNPHGFIKHLRWLESDIRDALFQRRLEYAESEYECDDETVWKTALPRLRDSVQTLIRTSTNDDQREESCKYFMAVVLLSKLIQQKGSNFRGRAAEFLQLCVLEHILGVVPFFNCKSGIDRTGVASALWTSVHQLLLGDDPPPLWEIYYLSLCYPMIVKLCHRIHGCGDIENKMRQIPMRQLAKCCFSFPETQLPFAAGGSSSSELLQKYSAVEELYQILHPNAGLHSHSALGSVPQRSYELVNVLFMSPVKEALVPRLQHAFFLNMLGTSTKIAAFSTGVFGLKYGDCGMVINQYNALAAQFLPCKICSPTRSLVITETRRGLTGTDVVVSKEFAPYLVAASDARGT